MDWAESLWFGVVRGVRPYDLRHAVGKAFLAGQGGIDLLGQTLEKGDLNPGGPCRKTFGRGLFMGESDGSI